MQQEKDVEELAESSASALSTSKKTTFTTKDSNLRLYSVFNPQTKIVHLIRHGHTTYLDGHLRTKSGKHAFDVILSPLGIKQALALRDKIICLGAELILTSPLTRALQTLQNAIDLTQIPEGATIEVSHLHAEHVHNSGDVGRPTSMLSKEFPMLSFAGIEETWWYSPPTAPNDPVNGIFQSEESMKNLEKRVGIFRRYLSSRPETTIVVIGHSTFFRALTKIHKRMENCEIRTIRV